MLRSGLRAGLLLAKQQYGFQSMEGTQQALNGLQQFRFIGGDKVPEFWGKKSEYTAGTDFLGTPTDHLERIHHRPLSPDVLEIDGKHMHYKFPWGPLSSIANRVTGVALSVGTFGAAWIALRGDISSTVHTLAATNAIVLFPFKYAVSYTILYHWLGAMRHFVWDHHKIGNQAEKNSLLEIPQVDFSSKALFGVAAVFSFVAALM
uniref:Succinate dehydrogenase cytochrome b560 subunit, mitochondrial n=1 Tax=Dunaliella tertiolecta TaxID=3047 RepID=A0A7S3VHG7_DUNTE|mmetsp:Transcript_18499/g.51913  ORF Transcript_18499/g.51913 Transcript_18499/m.51913 type:complete len:205 (+) Transcript_18499:75-689(+)|eukprot:CAMPEP_0202360584 /NCGR_PEP_ID=MMETSP1126-20121109/13468_1 /ASSEMBLY_ACC=CAM_ASM_000457 /TAXON_ID=3047 /ORGANISM="Dunaliella tertiolecta, Strain CCMP1320" /LENGTH=204 /DNA_ID=CAMNT_0048954325 /DNA_START=63 /DNA_END=677 /DNA_ORIENTATION=+